MDEKFLMVSSTSSDFEVTNV